MVIRESDRRFARNAYHAAVGLIAQRDADVADLAWAALTHPSAMTTRALLNAGAGRPWIVMLVEALAQVGIAAAEDVLGGDEIVDITQVSQAVLDMTADSEIPEEMQWNSDEGVTNDD